MINSNLRDIIRLSESDLTEIPIFKYKHDNRIDGIVRGISLELFMDRYDISDSNVIIEALKEHYADQLDGIISITKDDFITESDYKPIYDILYLCEVDIDETKDESGKLKQMSDKVFSFLKKKQADKKEEEITISDEQQEINGYDKILEKLRQEKEHAKSQKGRKFGSRFFYSMLFKLMSVSVNLATGNLIGLGFDFTGFVLGGGAEDAKNYAISHTNYEKLLDNMIDNVTKLKENAEKAKAEKEKKQNEN